MLCSKCKQRQANVFYSQAINGQKEQYSLCRQCAEEMNLFENTNSAYNINDFLTGFWGKDISIPPASKAVSSNNAICECGTDAALFSKTGKFGCANCYQVFSEAVKPVFRQIHGSTSHNGKIPSRAKGTLSKRREIENLRKELQQAIGNEEYERAAKIRDQIKQIEADLG